MLQDRNGYLWLGTYAGLVRFNGVEFTVFDRDRQPALPSNSIFSLHEDSKGAIWIGTNGGIAILRGSRMEPFALNSSLPHPHALGFLEDPAGGIWIGTRSGLCRFSAGKLVPTPVGHDLDASTVRGMVRDPDGRLWFAFDHGIVSRAEGSFRLESADISGIPFTSLASGRDGAIYAGTAGSGIARLAHGKWSFITAASGLTGPSFGALLLDKAGRLWAGSEGGGLCRIRSPSGPLPIVECRSSDQGLSSNIVRALLEDRERTIWAGTVDGLNALRNHAFVFYSRDQGLPARGIRSVMQSRDGTIWAGTEGGGIARLEGSSFKLVRPVDGPGPDSVRCLAEDPGGQIWAGTYAEGLFRLDGKSGKFTSFSTKNGLSGDAIFSLLTTRDGTLWSGNESGILDRYIQGHWEHVPLASTGSTSSLRPLCYTLHEDRSGTLWAGTSQGLFRVNPELPANYATGLDTLDIYSILDCGKGAMLAGGESGLYLFQNGTFSRVKAPDGPLTHAILQAIEDSRGDVWLSSSRGVLRIRKKDLDAYIDRQASTLPVKYFGLSDGLLSLNCSGASSPAAWSGQDGRLWFATNRGLAVIDPAQPAIFLPAPPVQINRVVVDGVPAGSDRVALIPPGSKSIEILYDALTFVAPGEIWFRYRLDGFDSAWIEAGARRTAFYTHLPPGKYTFNVSARRQDGEWARQPATIRIEVAPAFHQTPLFYILSGLTLGALLFAAYRFRVGQLALRSQELEETVAKRTEELDEKTGQLEERIRLFSELLETAPDSIVISDADGVIVIANRQTERTFGYEGGELIGQPLEILVPERARQVHEAHRAGFAKDPRTRPMGGGLELHGRQKDGTEIEVEISLSPMRTAAGALVTSIIRDVTQRRQSEQQLRLHAVALNSAANAIVITDRKGMIQWVNPAYTTLTGYTSEEAVGQNPRVLKSGIHDHAFYEKMWITILSGQTWHGETTNRRRDGSLYTEEQTIAPVRDYRGDITHFVAIKQDVTARKETERLRDSLVRTMVHDLRNPLSVIHGSLGILKDEVGSTDPEERTWTLDTLERASRQMLDLVTGILDVERLKLGEMPLELSLIDMSEILDAALLLQAPLAEAREQALFGESEKRLPPVQADRSLITRVLQNLVGNAIKFTPEGGTIRVNITCEGNEINVRVADTGPGIPEEVRRRLFGQFVTGRGKESGSGLGLAFCRLAIEAHGGRIWAESHPGEGTAFYFRLPVATEQTD
jgi:PAS domain S-box-containing protein